ncbi:hypothetical protein AVMA1855_25060 [Acidovorax sp. SUPP1855]|uniref:hypothetical protein n=1 Tax=Acidovorax sp. SUPP1855 TaxID=431774 RepID=UPI0023DE312D|nr:hypothetical protein [Acidovorax sp. SUPP1855]GKS87486.1 hypothetical protein AVMA1855_25060 [Acidovorax sp. SUPP1855]
MSKIVELKDAVHQLETDVAALTAAEREVENWSYQDLNRRDGSSAQDERHERMGREARESAWQAKQKVNSQKNLIAELARAI